MTLTYKNGISASEKRIRILPTSEIDDLFSRPNFNDEERLFWFDLDQEERTLLQSKSSLASKVDLIIQLGYFKSKHQFFSFTLDEVPDDVSYVMNHYYPDKVLVKSNLGREAKRLNQHTILKKLGFSLFDAHTHIPLLMEKSQSLCRISNDPLFLFRGLFDFIKAHKITIPGYTTFQERIISVALHRENNRLYSGLSLNMSLLERELLLTLLDESEQFYTITCLKKHPKNFKLTAIQKEVESFEKLLPFYQVASHILPLLDLSKTAIQYYSSLVDHYTVQGLSRINENQTCLWLLCFVYQRYRVMLDNLTTMLIYTSDQYKASVDEKSKELLVEELLKPSDQNWKIAKALRLYNDPETDDTKPFYHIKKQVHTFLPPDKIDQIVSSLENDEDRKNFRDQFYWVAVDKLAASYKQPLRLLVKSLTLNGDQHESLQKTHVFLKDKLNKQTPLSKVKFEDFPTQFISSKDAKFIYNEQDKIIHTNRYEFECYSRIASTINQSSLFVTESTRYNSLADELVPNWQDKKINIIKNLNNGFLNQSVGHFIDTQVKPLDQQIRDLNQDIQNGNNNYVKIKKEKTENEERECWTLPYTRKSEKIDNPFTSKLAKISIIHLLQIVNEQTGFLNEFTHIKPHYAKSKVDEMSVLATLVANGTNLGVEGMESLCDLKISDLTCADKNYIRLSTLRAANDLISNAISKLPIFKCWNLLDDLLLASADGQKMRTEREILLARFALKYFGLEKGAVSYSLIANHVPINCLLIGANMHESHSLFDLFYNNTSIIKPDVLSTDTEGSNQLNFFFLHVISKLFAPRYRSLSAKTESIISFGNPKTFENCLIRPNRAFNEKLVRDEEDNMQHIIASLLSGEANQSNIVRKLSSAGYASRTKQALWEMNAALMTQHLLTYIGDVGFRQAIQGGLCRGESYHQLRRAVERANGRNFRGTSDIQVATWNECARLLTNCVLYYNAFILNGAKEESDKQGDTERSQKLIRFSPATWGHINFRGRYIFLENNFDFDLLKIVQSLSDIQIM